MERSLVVNGKSLEQALSKASMLLHCEPERVAYEIVQEGKPAGRNGTEVPFKLRVIAMAAAPTNGGQTDEEDAEFNPDLPGLEATLTPLPPRNFCQALEKAFVETVQEFSAAQETDPLADGPAPDDAPVREIAGDVTNCGPKIEFDGHVRVFGSVHKGAAIHATGKIQVVGELEMALLSARGDITVGGGVLGTILSTHGSIACKFVQGGRIEAPLGNIIVAESVMHGYLHAGLQARVGDVVLGGMCYGERLVDLSVAGSDHSVPTMIFAGRNKRINDRIDAIRMRVERHVVRLDECDKVRRELLPVEERGEALPIGDRILLWRMTIRRGRIQADLQRLAKEKSRLLGLVNTERSSRIYIKNRICPKVRVTIDETAHEIKQTTQYVCFSKDYENGKIRMTSYQ